MKPINRIIIIETIISIILFGGTVASVVIVRNGGSWLWILTALVTGALACIISEDVQRLLEHKKKHK
jgi:hypothetical protein